MKITNRKVTIEESRDGSGFSLMIEGTASRRHAPETAEEAAEAKRHGETAIIRWAIRSLWDALNKKTGCVDCPDYVDHPVFCKGADEAKEKFHAAAEAGDLEGLLKELDEGIGKMFERAQRERRNEREHDDADSDLKAARGNVAVGGSGKTKPIPVGGESGNDDLLAAFARLFEHVKPEGEPDDVTSTTPEEVDPDESVEDAFRKEFGRDPKPGEIDEVDGDAE